MLSLSDLSLKPLWMHALSDRKIEAENALFTHYISLSPQWSRFKNLKSHSLNYLQLILNFTIEGMMFIAYLSSRPSGK
jgi:hypothetical protein